jgi:7-cyano-7-deazaguanine synthase
MTKKAVVLLSGGLDSATCLAMAQADGYDVYALSFSYGQRHSVELDKSIILAKDASVKAHKIVDIDMRGIGGSALTADIDVPKHDSIEEMDEDIPITYVPARNTIFLSYALAYAEVLESFDIFIGVNALDYSGYPDCRIEFIKAFEKMANLATASCDGGANTLVIHTPLIDLTKGEIIAKGLALGVDYGKTLSCYDPVDGDKPCGHCDSCLLRNKGFADNGMIDPAL